MNRYQFWYLREGTFVKLQGFWGFTGYLYPCIPTCMLPVLGLDNTTFIQRFSVITAMWLSAVEHYLEAEKLGPY
jgi:hypothetical protein